MKRYWGRAAVPAMDLEYLLGDVMDRVTPLDWDKVLHR
jgi:hypothetical protein